MNPNLNYNIGIITTQLHEHQKHINNLMTLWTGLRDHVNTIQPAPTETALDTSNFVTNPMTTHLSLSDNNITNVNTISASAQNTELVIGSNLNLSDKNITNVNTISTQNTELVIGSDLNLSDKNITNVNTISTQNTELVIGSPLNLSNNDITNVNTITASIVNSSGGLIKSSTVENCTMSGSTTINGADINGGRINLPNMNGVNFMADPNTFQGFFIDGDAGTAGHVLTSQGAGQLPIWSGVTPVQAFINWELTETARGFNLNQIRDAGNGSDIIGAGHVTAGKNLIATSTITRNTQQVVQASNIDINTPANGRIRVTLPGLYLITAHAGAYLTSDERFFALTIFINGTQYCHRMAGQINGTTQDGSNGHGMVSISAVAMLEAQDEIHYTISSSQQDDAIIDTMQGQIVKIN